MVKKIPRSAGLIFLYIFFYTQINSQKKETVDYFVSYEFIFLVDTIENKFSPSFFFTLKHFKGESRFIETNSIFNDSMGVEFENAHPEFLNPSSEEEGQKLMDLYSEQYKIWHKKVLPGGYVVQKLFDSRKVRNILQFTLPRSYLEEDMIYDWKLHSDTDTIAGHHCQLATVDYGGRKYMAWYAPGIPIPDGPYVFAGLPGLIVKIADEDNWYTFTLKDISVLPQDRFWEENFINQYYKSLDRKSFVDKLRHQQQNPRLPGVIKGSEERLFQIKERAKKYLHMLLEKSD